MAAEFSEPIGADATGAFDVGMLGVGAAEIDELGTISEAEGEVEVDDVLLGVGAVVVDVFGTVSEAEGVEMVEPESVGAAEIDVLRTISEAEGEVEVDDALLSEGAIVGCVLDVNTEGEGEAEESVEPVSVGGVEERKRGITKGGFGVDDGLLGVGAAVTDVLGANAGAADTKVGGPAGVGAGGVGVLVANAGAADTKVGGPARVGAGGVGVFGVSVGADEMDAKVGAIEEGGAGVNEGATVAGLLGTAGYVTFLTRLWK